MLDILDELYEPDDRDRSIFGEQYVATTAFKHGAWTTVARFAPCGGQPVEIDECRLPARFFRLRVLPDPNTVWTARTPFTLSTGSGDDMGRLMLTLARAVACGMVSLDLEHRGDA